jgi:hypothetical protein
MDIGLPQWFSVRTPGKRLAETTKRTGAFSGENHFGKIKLIPYPDEPGEFLMIAGESKR